MLIPLHDTNDAKEIQPMAIVGDAWTMEVVPRLPADRIAQARTLKAFQRVRGLATPDDLLRGLLGYVLGKWSTRQLGIWSVLVGLGDISETAWRKRLRHSNDWLQWLVEALVAAPVASEGSSLAVPAVAGRIQLVDGSRLRQPGGTGDDWRLHLAYDIVAGRMSQVRVTDCHGGERLDRYAWHAGDVIVADRGYGYRRSVATAAQHHADVVVRFTPATFPLETERGDAFNVLRWLRRGQGPERSWQGWCRWEKQRYRVRVVAVRLPTEAARVARERKRRHARKTGRTLQAETLIVAGWLLLLTTLDAEVWAPRDVARLYGARWQVELVFKKMKQLLRLNQIRTTNATSVEATVRALLVAWALHEDTTSWLRAVLHPEAAPETIVVSSWLLTGVGLETLRHQVHGSWTEARLQECLPRLRRFLCRRPRRREHQETAIRAWLTTWLQTSGERLYAA